MFYFAYYRDEFIVCEPFLPQLLAVLADLSGPVDEDTAVWHGSKIVVVMHGDGSLTWLVPQHKPAGEAAAERWTVTDDAA